MTLNNLGHVIDTLGEINAQIAELLAVQKSLKTDLADLPKGNYEGDLYNLTVSEFPVDVYDNEAIRAKCSSQLIAAHKSTRNDRRLTVGYQQEGGGSMTHNLEPLIDLLNSFQQRLTKTRDAMATAYYTTKTIHFPDSGDTVIACFLPDNQWHVYRDGVDEGQFQGIGATILEAIADMVENLKGE